MRRVLPVLVLCGLLLLAGCAEGDIDGEFTDGDDDGLGDSGPGDGSATPTMSRTADGGTGDDRTSTPTDGVIEVHAINVGQADATLLRTEEETMLIDSGDWRQDGETVIAYLESRGVDRIDHLVATHAHADHIGGHAAVIDHYETEKDGVGAVYDSGVIHTSQTYERYLDAVDRHDVPLYEVAEGDVIPFAGARAEVINPAEPGGDDLHYNSVGLRVAFGEHAFLFTGDAEQDAERRMVSARGSGLTADVYQAGHHGSYTSSTPEFLDAVEPALAVVSADYDSQYGHPHEDTLERFADRDVRAVWTAVHGTVVLVGDGESISVRTQHDATTDPRALRDADEATADPTDPVEERFVVGDGGGSARVAGPVSATRGVVA